MRYLLCLFAALVAAPLAAKQDLPPVGCIVDHSDRIPAAELAELVHSGFAPATKSGKATMLMLGQVVQKCRQSNGWAKAREEAAVRFFSAYILHDEAVANGKRFGLTDAMLNGYVAGLTPALRASYAAGTVTPEMNRAAFAHLQAAKIVPADMPVAEVQALGQAFNGGVYAVISQQDAAKAYAG